MPTEWSHSDGSTPRDIKIVQLNSDNRWYSWALADPNKLAIVTDEYPVVRFGEEQGRLVEAVLEAALDTLPPRSTGRCREETCHGPGLNL